MKKTREVIDALNGALQGEFLAIAQYMAHSKLAKNEGHLALAERLRTEAIDQGKHAEILTERILYLGGTPQTHLTSAPNIGQTVTERFQNDLALEHAAIQRLNDAIATARKKADNGSADLFTKLLVDEEEHAAWLQTQLAMIKQLGENAYLLGQIRPAGA